MGVGVLERLGILYQDQPPKLSESALPICDRRSREPLESHQTSFHVGRLNKQLSGKGSNCRNNISALTGKKRRQADRSAQLFPGTSLFLGHLQQGAAHSESRPLNSVTSSWSRHRPAQRHYLSLACISHQADNQHPPSQTCGCFIGPVLLYYDPQNPDCVSGLPRKAVCLLFCASVVQVYCLSNCPSSCRCLSLSVLISKGTVDSMWSW